MQALFGILDSSGKPARYGLIEASTKAGKTISCIVWLFEEAFRGRRGQNFWWIAPIRSQAEIAFRRLKQAIPNTFYESNESRLTITLLNGAVIWFKSGEIPDGLYGEDVYAAVLDEASRMREEAFHAIRSTLTATRGPMRIIGNVKGSKNWFYTMAREAEKGAPNMHYSKIIAADAVNAGILSADEIADAQRVLPEHVFRELYLAEPSADGGNPFGDSHIANCTVDGLSDGEPIAWGWDLAKSVDWTVGIALDVDGAVCRFLRFQAPWEKTVATIIEETGYVQALVDSTGVGDPIVERLQTTAASQFEGYKFSLQTKQKLMEGLAVAIQKREVTFPRGVIPIELGTFEYFYRPSGVSYAAQEGAHDDAVCALALAVQCKGTNNVIDVWNKFGAAVRGEAHA